MHDLLQELGRDIVSQESNDPGSRSWLCIMSDNLSWIITLEYSSIYKLDMDNLYTLELLNLELTEEWQWLEKNNGGYKCRDNLYN